MAWRKGAEARLRLRPHHPPCALPCPVSKTVMGEATVTIRSTNEGTAVRRLRLLPSPARKGGSLRL